MTIDWNADKEVANLNSNETHPLISCQPAHHGYRVHWGPRMIFFAEVDGEIPGTFWRVRNTAGSQRPDSDIGNPISDEHPTPTQYAPEKPGSGIGSDDGENGGNARVSPDPAYAPELVEAVAWEIYVALAGQPGCLITRDGAYRATRAALSTIRKHQENRHGD